MNRRSRDAQEKNDFFSIGERGQPTDLLAPLAHLSACLDDGNRALGFALQGLQHFEVNLGALPDNTDSLVMPAVQTYDDGTVVSWDQTQTPGGPEPEHPAPTLKLVDGTGGAHDMAAAGHTMAHSTGPDAPSDAGASAGGVDNTARWLGGIGLVLGALGLGLGGGAALRGRRAGRNS